MFKKIKTSALSVAYGIARKKGLNCPDCEKPLQLPAQMPSEEKSETISCQTCDWFGSPSILLLESTTQAFTHGSPQHQPQQTEKPTDSKIQETRDGETANYLLPAPKRLNFFLFFAALWITITAIVSGGFLSAYLSGEGFDGDLPEWALIPFFAIFWAIGIGVFTLGVRTALTEHLIIITEQNVTHLRKLLGKVKKQSITRDQVSRVILESSYQQNDTPVYELRIYSKDAQLKPIKFGHNLTDDEKGWLHYSLEQQLTPPDTPSTNPYLKPTDHPLPEIHEKNIQLAPLPSGGNDTFKLTIQKRYPQILLFIAVLLFIPIFIFGHDLFDADFSESDTPLFAQVLDVLFTAIPALVTLTLILTSLTLFVIGFKNLGTSVTYLFDKDTLTVSHYKKALLLKEKSYQRTSFSTSKTTNSGNNNGSPRYSLKLLGTPKSLTLHSFLPRETADALETALAQWLRK